jgi:hypothetical protein
MKKTTLKRLIIIFIALLFIAVGYLFINKASEKKEAQRRIAVIPEFHFQGLNGAPFTNTNLKANQTIVFVYFNSECGYCQDEAQHIHTHLNKLNGIQLIFVSTESTEAIRQFANEYQLLNAENVTFVSDADHLFTKSFDATSIPYTLVYDASHRLVLRHKGELKVEAILKYAVQ